MFNNLQLLLGIPMLIINCIIAPTLFIYYWKKGSFENV